MAEAIFQRLVDDAGLSSKIRVDSAGTSSWHVGEKAHPGTRRVLSKHGINYDGRSRKVRPSDFDDPGAYIIGMDQGNIGDMRRSYGDHPNMYRLLDFAANSDVSDVPDPYYNGRFEEVYQLVEDGCRGLLATIRQQKKI